MTKQWRCPCNGCKKAAKQIIDQIVDEYKTCPNLIEIEERLYCSTWYRHDDCEKLMNLLYKITNDIRYTRPEIRPVVRDAMNKMLTDPQTYEILKRLEDNDI